jgi:PIN domain nuclease of toxin-antitoxin system
VTRVLLDTNAFLWWTAAPDRLSDRARDTITSTDEVLVSHATAWELAIKAGLGKLRLPTPVDRFFPDQLAANGFVALPLSFRDLARVEGLPHHHRDPFDRVLVAQAQGARLAVVSSDEVLSAYGVDRVW